MTKVENERAARDAELRKSLDSGLSGLLADPLLKQALELADGLAADYMRQLPDDPLGYVRSQCLRATGSVMANIAEGIGRGYEQDCKRFLLMARGSAYEAVLWLKLTGKTDLYTEAVSLAESLDARLKSLLNY